jgi:hypothetical protein
MEEETTAGLEAVVRERLRFPLLDYIALERRAGLGSQDKIGELRLAVADRQDLLKIARRSGERGGLG